MADGNYWPHKMQKGLLRGRTFKSQSEYQHALDNLNSRNGGLSLDGETVLRVVDAYDLLIESGAGRTKAAELVSLLMR